MAFYGKERRYFAKSAEKRLGAGKFHRRDEETATTIR
jgi:hypothetical protein